MRKILTRFMSLALVATAGLTTALGQESSEPVAQVTYADGTKADVASVEDLTERLERDDYSELAFTLLKDVEFESVEVYSPTTLDLNGHKISGELEIYTSVTINDSGENGAIVTEGGYVLTVNFGGELAVNGGTFLGKYSIFVGDGSTAVINNCTTVGSKYGMIVHGTAIINNGTFKGDDKALYVDGTAYIYGGTFDGGINSQTGATISLGEGYVYKTNSGDIYTTLEIGQFYASGAVVNPLATAVRPASLSKVGTASKTIDNGRIVIINDGIKYDLAGRKL